MKINARELFGQIRVTSFILVVLGSLCFSGIAQAYTFDISPAWDVSLNTTVNYTLGFRTAGRNSKIAGNPTYDQSDYLFDQGDVVQNTISLFTAFQAEYQNHVGFRVSGTAFDNFSLLKNDSTQNPRFPDSFSTYPSGKFSSNTRRLHVRGLDLLDGFVFDNTRIGGFPVSVKAGRLSKQWGNALFFGFTALSYSQQPEDFIRAFVEPGTPLNQLFLPRTQILGSVDLTRDLTVEARYYFEFRQNRFSEGGTYLGTGDFLYDGPKTGGAITDINGNSIRAGVNNQPYKVTANSDNYGIKVDWSPQWSKGRLGFYYRKFDEVQFYQQLELFNDGGGDIHLAYPRGTQLFGLTYEAGFGRNSFGLEVDFRRHTGLPSAFATGGTGGYTHRQAARGNIVNAIGNVIHQFPRSVLWDRASLTAEIAYTHLASVTSNENRYLGRGHPSCTDSVDPTQPGGAKDGCATKDAEAIAVQFDPSWFKVLPNIDFDLPLFIQYGIDGNPAELGGAFYAQHSIIASMGLEATYKSRQSLRLEYHYFHYDPVGNTVDSGFGQQIYPGGNGVFNLNDKNFVTLTYKVAF